MGITLTETQKQRLRELGADASLGEKVFSSIQERDAGFKMMEKELIEEEKQRLQDLRSHHRCPASFSGLINMFLTGSGIKFLPCECANIYEESM